MPETPALDFREDPAILATVVDAMEAGVFTVDKHGRFVAWSDGAERITGYRSGDLIGRSCRVLEGPGCTGFSSLADLLDQPDSVEEGLCRQECKLLSREGRELHIHGIVRLVHDAQGEVLGAVGCFTDVTDLLVAHERLTLLEEQVGVRQSFGQLVGKSRPMQEVYRRLRLAGDSAAVVLVRGESGTGKELAARAIHELSTRRSGPFVAFNGSAIPDTLLESELFGHVKGAFTGAVRDKTGLFQAARGGTLFLDEVGDFSPMMQLKLLRVLQEREIRRLGDERPIDIDVRIVSATNRCLEDMLRSGEMREDFYYRIRVFEVTLPPLRERREDIPLLVDHFIRQLNQESGRQIRGITPDAARRLETHDWPGNIRELKNALEHAFVTVQGDRLTLLDLPERVLRPPETGPRAGARSGIETRPEAESDRDADQRARILDALERSGGRREAAARLLGVSRVTLWKRMRRLGIEAPQRASR